MRRGLAGVVAAVLSVVVFGSALTRKMDVKGGEKWPFGLRVAHPQQMKSIPEDLIPPVIRHIARSSPQGGSLFSNLFVTRHCSRSR